MKVLERYVAIQRRKEAFTGPRKRVVICHVHLVPAGYAGGSRVLQGTFVVGMEVLRLAGRDVQRIGSSCNVSSVNHR